jgi:serine/threonine-protein kinase PRP4
MRFQRVLGRAVLVRSSSRTGFPNKIQPLLMPKSILKKEIEIDYSIPSQDSLDDQDDDALRRERRLKRLEIIKKHKNAGKGSGSGISGSGSGNVNASTGPRPVQGGQKAMLSPKKNTDDQYTSQPTLLKRLLEDSDSDDMFASEPTKDTLHQGRMDSTSNMALTDNWDDEEGYYRIVIGEILEDRYLVTQNLGKGGIY